VVYEQLWRSTAGSCHWRSKCLHRRSFHRIRVAGHASAGRSARPSRRRSCRPQTAVPPPAPEPPALHYRGARRSSPPTARPPYLASVGSYAPAPAPTLSTVRRGSEPLPDRSRQTRVFASSGGIGPTDFDRRRHPSSHRLSRARVHRASGSRHGPTLPQLSRLDHSRSMRVRVVSSRPRSSAIADKASGGPCSARICIGSSWPDRIWASSSEDGR